MEQGQSNSYKVIITHYERCLEQFGDSSKGVDWPNEKDAQTRYKVMMDLVEFGKNKNVSLLDFGCGTAHLLEFIMKQSYADQVQYSGLDISEKFIEVCRKKFPDHRFMTSDILEDKDGPGQFDYIIMNGVFTEKQQLSFDEMWSYFREMITGVFRHADKGIAFNVMSTQVDWEREDLFHLPMDLLASFLWASISKNFVFRKDYGLYEYTCYVYREPWE
jgi:SAM-dependent methyltransferase